MASSEWPQKTSHMSSKRKLNYNDNKNNNKYYYTYSYYSNNNKQQQQRLRLRLAPQSNNNNNSIKLSACSPMEIYEWQQITTTRTATTRGWSRQFASGRGGVGGLHHAGSFKTLQSQMFWFEWFADSQESFLSPSIFLCLSGACAMRVSQT